MKLSEGLMDLELEQLKLQLLNLEVKKSAVLNSKGRMMQRVLDDIERYKHNPELANQFYGSYRIK
ncbi:hypothetical protein N7645_15240 [Pseudomonas juntendi]|uniref:hypothetical protein n=1 Tax=Pseudomonas TaxID=286 RepID=UPI0012ADC902|nr:MULTISPECIES: hypothetical protein [Pseudomonas]MDG9918243.1 hypothetical protein [Pseudomonas juntendi]MDH0507691.1 hypothetical protein [Pseudomonas juntendi]MDH1044827.1 hypothetical protein [Pseudomonas juntendi]MRT62358.1 hypothetical protein [Pseudomonas sp. CAH-1]